jgi:LmbE family N-acetylglucosaminyl deacetylase
MASDGAEVFWLLVTAITEDHGYTKSDVERRDREIERVASRVPFRDVHRLDIPTTALDTVSDGELITRLKDALDRWQPDTVIIPWRNDAHTDHMAVYDAALAATKPFRAPYITTILAMDILSETNFARLPGFHRNWYVDITGYLETKLELLSIYETEMAPHPFPRSADSVRALATLRGSEIGVEAAEAFHLIRHRHGT